MLDVCGRLEFFGEKKFCPKNEPNEPKIGFFEFIEKNWSLIFAEFVL